MIEEEYKDFVFRYKGCGACFPMYNTLSRAEKMWFTAIQKDVADLEKENVKLKEFVNAPHTKGRKTTRGDYIKTVWDLSKQLTKAKEIINKLKALYFSPVETKDDVKRQDEILSEAEQFLKYSEVEK